MNRESPYQVFLKGIQELKMEEINNLIKLEDCVRRTLYLYRTNNPLERNIKYIPCRTRVIGILP